MISYTIAYNNINTRLLQITVQLSQTMGEKTSFKLPVWRPGRYEKANFSGNIYQIIAENENSESLPVKKTDANQWQVSHPDGSAIILHYDYYAFDHDGGGSFLGEEKLYINPINCFLYTDYMRVEPCLLNLNIPDNYEVATSLALTGDGFLADSFDEMVDSPLVASSRLHRIDYEVFGKPISIWLEGYHQLDLDKLKNDFIAFTDAQRRLLPWEDKKPYHFIIQILPFKAYHGVEHENSTIIILGPEAASGNENFYEQLMGVSSHELFHYWNVKRLKPSALSPYDFSQENYFDTGYVVEGFTVYYGDLMLKRSGVFNEDWYLKELNRILKRHYDQFGRMRFSLLESSLDLWVDGYKSAAPNRKVSIYIEGCLIALLLDLMIRSKTNHQKSLDDVMQFLWHDPKIRKNGYGHQDIIAAVSSISKVDLSDFFERHVGKPLALGTIIQPLLSEVGLKMDLETSSNILEKSFGFRAQKVDAKFLITNIEPQSPAFDALSIQDEIITIDKIDINDWLAETVNDQIVFQIKRDGFIKEITLEKDDQYYFSYGKIRVDQSADQAAHQRRRAWLNLQKDD